MADILLFVTCSGWLWIAGGAAILVRWRGPSARPLGLAVLSFGVGDILQLLPDSLGIYMWIAYAATGITAVFGLVWFLRIVGKDGPRFSLRIRVLARTIVLLWLVPVLWYDMPPSDSDAALSWIRRLGAVAIYSMFAVWYAMGALLAGRFHADRETSDHTRSLALAFLCAGVLAYPVYDQAWWLAGGQWFNLGVGASTLLMGLAWMPNDQTGDRRVAHVMSFLPAGFFLVGVVARRAWPLDAQTGVDITFRVIKDIGLVLIMVAVERYHLFENSAKARAWSSGF